MKISDIKVSDRHRKDLGDLSPLMESIKELGLLHPIVVTLDGTLVAGQRRLEALRKLGRTDVDVTLVTNLKTASDLLKAERDENTCRLDMTRTEAVSLGRELEKLERPAAEERMRANLKQNRSVNVTERERKGQTRDIVGEAVGMSGPTYQRAKAVVAAAEAGDPVAIKAMEEMDAGGGVLTAYKKIAKPAPKPKLAAVKDNGHKRTQKQAIASLRQAAVQIDSTVAGFDMDAFGDLSVLVTYPEAQEWIDLLLDATQRLSGHVRTLKRHRNGTQPEEATS